MVLIHSVFCFFFSLKKYDSTIQGYARMGGEIGVLIGVALYLGAAAREARFLGRKMFFENLVSSNLPLKRWWSLNIFITCVGHCSVESPLSDFLHVRHRHGLLALVLSESRGRHRRRARHVIDCSVLPFLLQVRKTCN